MNVNTSQTTNGSTGGGNPVSSSKLNKLIAIAEKRKTPETKVNTDVTVDSTVVRQITSTNEELANAKDPSSTLSSSQDGAASAAA